MKKVILILALALPFFLNSCGGGSGTSEEATQDTVAQTEAAPVVDLSEGEAIYKEKCVVCHQADGVGIANTFPPLKNSDYLLADKKRAVYQVIHGSAGGAVVNGVTYKSQPMPPQGVTKEQAVAVINYVLNSFGNQGGYISMEEVADIEMPAPGAPAK
jgi:mono/diheme cytochrome c family protein